MVGSHMKSHGKQSVTSAGDNASPILTMGYEEELCRAIAVNDRRRNHLPHVIIAPGPRGRCSDMFRGRGVLLDRPHGFWERGTNPMMGLRTR